MCVVSAGFTITELSVSEDIGLVALTFEVAEGTPRRDTLFTVFVGDATATLGNPDSLLMKLK